MPKSIRTKPKSEFGIKIDKWRQDADGLHFSGTLTMPRMSLNGWIYFPEELANQDGKTVPLYINHEEKFDPNAPIRGSISTVFDSDTWELRYNGIATDQEAIDGIKSKKYQFMSMGANWGDYDYIRGYYIPKDISISEGSLTDQPGVIGTSVNVDSFYVDNFHGDTKIQEFKKCEFNCEKSLKQKLDSTESKPAETQAENKDTSETKTEEKKEDTTKCPDCGQFIEKDKMEEHKATHKPTEGSPEEEKEESPEEEKKEGDVKSSLEPQETTSTSMTEQDQTKTDSTSPEKKPEPEVKTDTEKKPEPQTQKVEVKVDNTEVVKEIIELRKVFSDFSKATNGPGTQRQGTVATDKVDPQAARAKFYDHVTESLRKFQFVDWSFIKTSMEKDGYGLDAIGVTELGGSAGAQWLENITILPSGVRANLRDTCEVVEITRGAKECHFTLISTPSPVDGTSGNEAPNIPDDVTQSITDIVATPVERLLKQRLTDKAARSTQINLGNAIATTFRNAEGLDEDDKVLTELNGLNTSDTAGWVIAGGHADEISITSSDIMTADLIAQAKEAILNSGWAEAEMVGQLVCVMSPTQMRQLMKDTNIQRFIEWVANGDALKNGYIPLLHGVELRVSTKIPTGTAASSKESQRAFVYIKGVAMGLGFTKEMEIETARYPEQRATTIIGSYELAAKNKAITAVCPIYTFYK